VRSGEKVSFVVWERMPSVSRVLGFRVANRLSQQRFVVSKHALNQMWNKAGPKH